MLGCLLLGGCGLGSAVFKGSGRKPRLNVAATVKYPPSTDANSAVWWPAPVRAPCLGGTIDHTKHVTELCVRYELASGKIDAGLRDFRLRHLITPRFGQPGWAANK